MTNSTLNQIYSELLKFESIFHIMPTENQWISALSELKYSS